MAQLLLIDLPDNETAGVDWLLWDDGERRVLDRGRLSDWSTLSDLKALSRQYSTYVLVPGEHVTSSRVTLPAGGRVGQAALPYQLEEQLCGDLDQQHIAHEKLISKRPCLVSVVDRQLMARWVEVLQQAGLRVKSLAPDYLFLPDNTVLLAPQRALLRYREYMAALDRDNLPLWWSLVDSGDDQDAATLPLLLTMPEDQGWQPAHRERQPVASRLEAIAGYWQQPPVDMLQGEFSLRDPWRDLRQAALWPVAAALAVLVLHWVLLGVETLQLQRQIRALDDAVEQVYRQAFPEAQRIVNARSQMRSQLQALERGGGGGPLMVWMEKTSLAMRGRGDIDINQLNYQQQPLQLRLNVRASSYGAVDELTQALREQQLQVERGAFGQQDQEISGQLLISGGQP